MGAKPSTHLNEHTEEEDQEGVNRYRSHMDCRTNFAMAPRPAFMLKCGETKDMYSPSVAAIGVCQPFARPEQRPTSTRAQRFIRK